MREHFFQKDFNLRTTPVRIWKARANGWHSGFIFPNSNLGPEIDCPNRYFMALFSPSREVPG
jgi:hypothetical protein